MCSVIGIRRLTLKGCSGVFTVIFQSVGIVGIFAGPGVREQFLPADYLGFWNASAASETLPLESVVHVEANPVATAAAEVEWLSELALVRRWLAHTDDPNRKIVFADPADAHVYSAVARRVYNVNVVYRLRSAGDTDAPWHRIRVVTSRKGIERIDAIC